MPLLSSLLPSNITPMLGCLLSWLKLLFEPFSFSSILCQDQLFKFESEKSAFPFIRRSFMKDKYISSPILCFNLIFNNFFRQLVSNSYIFSSSGTKRVSSIAFQFYLSSLTLIICNILTQGVHSLWSMLVFCCIFSKRFCLTFAWIWDEQPMC